MPIKNLYCIALYILGCMCINSIIPVFVLYFYYLNHLVMLGYVCITSIISLFLVIYVYILIILIISLFWAILLSAKLLCYLWLWVSHLNHLVILDLMCVYVKFQCKPFKQFWHSCPLPWMCIHFPLTVCFTFFLVDAIYKLEQWCKTSHFCMCQMFFKRSESILYNLSIRYGKCQNKKLNILHGFANNCIIQRFWVLIWKLDIKSPSWRWSRYVTNSQDILTFYFGR